MGILKYFFLMTFSCLVRAEIAEIDLLFKVNTNISAIQFDGKIKDKIKIDFQPGRVEMIEINAKSLTTGIDLRDGHMWEKIFLDVTGNQKISFHLKESNCNKEVLACTVKGEFLINKKIKSYSLEFKKDQNFLVSSFNINLKDFEITAPSYMGVSVDENVPLILKVRF